MQPLSLRTFVWRVIASHALTYATFGLLASTLLDYATLYAETDLRYLMRPTDSAMVAAGPTLQLFRGTLFALVLWPLAERIVHGARGALLLYGLMLGLAVLGTAGPAPGSLEGMVYTHLPLRIHLIGLPEVVLQTGAFSLVLVSWYRNPARWKNIVAIAGCVLIVLMSTAGLLAALHVIAPP